MSIAEAIGRIDNAQSYLRRVVDTLSFARVALQRAQASGHGGNAAAFLGAAAAALVQAKDMSRHVVAAVASACRTED